MKIGVIVRTDNTGLGTQSRALAKMLSPVTELKLSNGEDIPGFPEYEKFLRVIDVMITAETPYTYEAWNWAKMAGVKTFCQPNWEFFDGLVQPNMPHPDQYWMPSYWHLEDMQKLFPNTIYLPPPTIDDDFTEVRAKNLARKGKPRFVHVVGNPAVYDRNGWGLVMDALSHTNSDFELVVYAQKEITGIADPRVRYHIFDQPDYTTLYEGFDALILPRRYGGLCLPMNEGLIAGLPVIMTDTSPNNRVLPKEWLVPAYVSDHFEGRAPIDVHSVLPQDLAAKIDWLCQTDLAKEKAKAYKLGYDNYSDKVLKPKYEEILNNG